MKKKEKFNIWFKHERLNRGMNQTDFGKFLGVSFPTISYLELGKHKPSFALIKVISEKLNIEISKLNEMINR